MREQVKGKYFSTFPKTLKNRTNGFLCKNRARGKQKKTKRWDPKEIVSECAAVVLYQIPYKLLKFVLQKSYT